MQCTIQESLYPKRSRFLPQGMHALSPLLYSPRYAVHLMESSNLMADLFPHASPEERSEALESIRRYLRLIVRIYDWIQSDPERYHSFKTLTEELKRTRIAEERSNITQHNNISEA
jgi:hypothetical protein